MSKHEHTPLNRSEVGMRPFAAFTMVNNESFFLPIWIKHYSQFFEPQDLWVLNHNPDQEFTAYLEKEKQKGINVVNIHDDKFFNELWRRDIVNHFQHFLVTSYRAVIYNDVDELLTVNPESKYTDLKDYILKFIESGKNGVRAQGYNIVSNPGVDKPIDLSIPIMQQRERWKPDIGYCKPYLTSIPVDYVPGFHTTESEYLITQNIYEPGEYLIDQDLFALHLHYIDIDQTIKKNNKRKVDQWCEFSMKHGLSYQNLPKSFEQEKQNYLSFYYNTFKIPEKFKNLI